MITTDELKSMKSDDIKALHCAKLDALAETKRAFYQQSATYEQLQEIAQEIVIIRQHIEKVKFGKAKLNARQMLLGLMR